MSEPDPGLHLVRFPTGHLSCRETELLQQAGLFKAVLIAVFRLVQHEQTAATVIAVQVLSRDQIVVEVYARPGEYE